MFPYQDFPRALWGSGDKPLIPPKGYFFARHSRVRSAHKTNLKHRGSLITALVRMSFGGWGWEHFYVIGHHEMEFLCFPDWPEMPALGSSTATRNVFQGWITEQSYIVRAGDDFYTDEGIPLGDVPAGYGSIFMQTLDGVDLTIPNIQPYLANYDINGSPKKVIIGAKICNLGPQIQPAPTGQAFWELGGGQVAGISTTNFQQGANILQGQFHAEPLNVPHPDQAATLDHAATAGLDFIEEILKKKVMATKKVPKEAAIFVEKPTLPIISEQAPNGKTKLDKTRYAELEKLYISLVEGANSMYGELISKVDAITVDYNEMNKAFNSYKKNSIEFEDLQFLMKGVAKQAGFTLPRIAANMNGKDLIQLFMTEVMVRMKGVGPVEDEVP